MREVNMQSPVMTLVDDAKIESATMRFRREIFWVFQSICTALSRRRLWSLPPLRHIIWCSPRMSIIVSHLYGGGSCADRRTAPPSPRRSAFCGSSPSCWRVICSPRGVKKGRRRGEGVQEQPGQRRLAEVCRWENDRGHVVREARTEDDEEEEHQRSVLQLHYSNR